MVQLNKNLFEQASFLFEMVLAYLNKDFVKMFTFKILMILYKYTQLI